MFIDNFIRIKIKFGKKEQFARQEVDKIRCMMHFVFDFDYDTIHP